MPDRELVSAHYTHGRLVDAIAAGIVQLGKTTASVTVEDLGPVDEFHVGGRVATEAFLDQLDIAAEHRVLDVGCGLGGASRFAAARYGCRVTGVDLTPEYVATGNTLCAWVGLGERVTLEVGDATALDIADASFDRAFVMHVGMNIADKAALAAELFRVLRPGGMAGIYDVMLTGDGDLAYPVPWAASAAGSALATPAAYRAALTRAGFAILAERNRRDFAVEFFARLKARSDQGGGPPPLGIHLLMGDSAPLKVKNMIDNIVANRVAPVELVAEKPA
ncbi:MAG: methyltransferase domain-containing protein [Gammaproteobacteria bacterium]|nr:methyltransferase domain-containing protein [Gammaproteobacteria bacterium]